MLLMYLLLFLITLTSLRAQDDEKCSGIIVNDNYYDKEMLFDDFGRSYNLAIHDLSGLLFFSHAIRNETYSFRRIISCNINDKVCNEVEGTVGGNSVFCHRGNNDIYFGGYNGIHQYNFKLKSALLVAETGKPIWGLFVSDTKFYYTTYPAKTLYSYNNGTFVKVPEVANVQVDTFFISKRNILYFSNSTALYRVDKPYVSFDPPRVINDKIKVRQIIDDYEGNVYFCASDGIYMDDYDNNVLKKIADITDMYGMSFIDLTSSRGHLIIIYSDAEAIYKLTPSINVRSCMKTRTQSKKKKFSFSVLLESEW